MAEKRAESMLLTEIRGLRADLKASTDTLVSELGTRIDANTGRLDSIDARLDSIDGRLQVSEEGATWFRHQVLAL